MKPTKWHGSCSNYRILRLSQRKSVNVHLSGFQIRSCESPAGGKQAKFSSEAAWREDLAPRDFPALGCWCRCHDFQGCADTPWLPFPCSWPFPGAGVGGIEGEESHRRYRRSPLEAPAAAAEPGPSSSPFHSISEFHQQFLKGSKVAIG